jgi:hypothetical protein
MITLFLLFYVKGGGKKGRMEEKETLKAMTHVHFKTMSRCNQSSPNALMQQRQGPVTSTTSLFLS